MGEVKAKPTQIQTLRTRGLHFVIRTGQHPTPHPWKGSLKKVELEKVFLDGDVCKSS